MLNVMISALRELEMKYDVIYSVGIEHGNVQFFEYELGQLMNKINWLNKRIIAAHPMYN